MTQGKDVAVAISGGGHRATVFGLGALLAVTDSELNKQTTSISSVSGGSIANAIALTGPDFGTTNSAAFEVHIAKSLRAISSRGLLLGGAPATKAYLRVLVLSLVAGVVGLVTTLIAALLRCWVVTAIAGAVGLIGLAFGWWLLRQRALRTERAIDAELLGGKHLTMADMKAQKSSVHHVICTTELQTGEPFYFTNRAVYGYRFGGNTGDVGVALATAVQASCCVPGMFNPRVVPLKSLGVHPPFNREHVQSKDIANIVLVDGGVYDNMSDQWEHGITSRMKSWDELVKIQPDRAHFLIVVNGSGGWNDPKPVGLSGPSLELNGLLRSQAVQYDRSTSDRRQALYSIFRHSETDAAEEKLDGVFAQITDSPYRIPQLFVRGSDAKAQRAKQALEFLNQHYNEAEWDAIVKRTAGTATTLAKLGLDLSTELLEPGRPAAPLATRQHAAA